MTTEIKTPTEIAQLELAVINVQIEQMTAIYNVQLARLNNQKAAKETQITTLQEAENA